MTMNYKIADIETAPIFGNKEPNIKTRIDWISHGNYAIFQTKPGEKENTFGSWTCIELEAEYFDEIIKAFENKPITDDPFEPFFCKTLPKRGMDFYPQQLRVWFLGNKKAMVLQQFDFLGWGAPHAGEPMGFTFEDFKKIRDLALNAKYKPYHCCVFNDNGELEAVHFDKNSFKKEK